ncbi:MAG: pyridoxamine 5'-phosphate oxidase family protein [Hyphomicrobium sp.]|jgi:predicted pyridoxine 5'-phosphate oxidase superfamily flavin-nucleotide-binding protein|nr:pyridoxamine 5'-phosphate oxidase family protein [Hyphomicrobium sp.]
MSTPASPVSDVAFTPAVKAAQTRLGSRDQFERMEKGHGWPSHVTSDLAEVIAAARSFYLGTASAAGQPYIQHRGGPAGFLKVLDERTLGFADFAGNKQYITAGNLSENPLAFIFLMDYARRRRVKLWGRAKIIEDDEELLSRLRPPVGSVRAERVIIFELEAWDRNCAQYIPQLVPIEEVQSAIHRLQQRIADLESQIKARAVLD